MLLDALDRVTISDAERASLAWLCGFEKDTVENIAAVIFRARWQARAAGLCGHLKPELLVFVSTRTPQDDAARTRE